MNLGEPADVNYPKPLPTPGRDEKLPPPPPSDWSSAQHSPPAPPPKIVEVFEPQPHQLGPQPPQISPLNTSGLGPGLSAPSAPMSPASPTSPVASNESKPKKSNPLIDLIETEKLYVDQLTGIIRKVAAAWSRSNLPPPDLDSMFRSIESVYKSNRSLHSKLKEIGTNPSSPKALGDLLMRWIDDLEAPYTAYCTKYCAGFDEWEPVQSNARLGPILATFSAAIPPPQVAGSAAPALWTLDGLFLLPKARLKYYKKLYNRLLKSTTPGRSDHRLLIGALDKLDKLLATLEARQMVQAGSSILPLPAPPLDTEDEVVIDLRGETQEENVPQNGPSRLSEGDRASRSSSARGSSLSGTNDRMSRETASTSISRGSTSTISMPISDLERRLATERTIDIFTMQPKAVRLQMAPPSLTYTRQLRFSADVVITLTPKSTGVEVVHRQGHIFLLSDLFLICERIPPEERSRFGPDGPDMSLCYPPLAGKVLRVSEVNGQDTTIQVAIMRKETLFLRTESVPARNFMIAEFKECIEFASSLPPPSRQPPPPMPTLHRNDSAASVPSNPPPPPEYSQGPGSPSGTTSPPGHRSLSPNNGRPMMSMNSPAQSNIDGQMAHKMSNLILSPEAQVQQGAQRVPSLHEPLPGPLYNRTSSAAQPFSAPATPSPSQFGPPRGASMEHQPQNPNLGGGPGNGPHLALNTGGSPYPNPGLPNHHQQLPPRPQPPYAHTPGRAPSDPSFQGGIRKSPSSRSLHESSTQPSAPPLPPLPGGYPAPSFYGTKNNSYSSLPVPQTRTLLPSAQMRAVSMADPASLQDLSPPQSPTEAVHTGPVTSSISAQMKCKVFLQQQHAQWKSLGSAKLKLYNQQPTNVKQLVVEADKDKSVLISTIVLTDGVERVGKTGVAIELSDKGSRTGIIYMIQLRNESSAGGLFDSLLAGSDRRAKG